MIVDKFDSKCNGLDLSHSDDNTDMELYYTECSSYNLGEFLDKLNTGDIHRLLLHSFDNTCITACDGYILHKSGLDTCSYESLCCIPCISP